jgi:hypothetical protein
MFAKNHTQSAMITPLLIGELFSPYFPCRPSVASLKQTDITLDSSQSFVFLSQPNFLQYA